MHTMAIVSRFDFAAARRALRHTASALLGMGLIAVAPHAAQALTIVLDFVPSTTTDQFNVVTNSESFAAWGFTGMDLAAIRSATLSEVSKDYLSYPSFATNASSPLPAGKELNINFTSSIGLNGPGNGDKEWYYVAIGNGGGSQSFLGQACMGCVRGSNGQSSVSNGTVVGSILSDNIAGLLSYAKDNTQRINLLAGTVAHEIGHSLFLDHPSAALANPGESSFSIMATGAAPTSMPNGERVKNRAFAYSEFQTLVQTVGLRDAVSPVPEPSTWLMLSFGLVGLGWARQRRQA